jgi:hypothetical protein
VLVDKQQRMLSVEQKKRPYSKRSEIEQPKRSTSASCRGKETRMLDNAKRPRQTTRRGCGNRKKSSSALHVKPQRKRRLNVFEKRCSSARRQTEKPPKLPRTKRNATKKNAGVGKNPNAKHDSNEKSTND